MAKKSAPAKDIPVTPIPLSGESTSASKKASVAARKTATPALKSDKKPKASATGSKKKQKEDSEPITVKNAAKQKVTAKAAATKKSKKQTSAPENAVVAAPDIPAQVETSVPVSKKKTTEKTKSTKVTSEGKPVPTEVVAKLTARKRKATEPETIETPPPVTPDPTPVTEAEAKPIEKQATDKPAARKARIKVAAVPVYVEATAEQELTEAPKQPVTEAAPVAVRIPAQAVPESPADPSVELTFLSAANSTELHLERGAVLYTAGDDCTRVYFVKKGSFSAVASNGNGSEIVVYNVGAGEVCVLSVAAALANEKHRITAVLNETTDVLAVSSEKLTELLDTDAKARSIVYSQMTQRLMESLSLMEEVVFHHKDVRLATVLSKKVTWDNLVWPGTIRDLADSTGTTIAVTKLILQEFQRLGLVSLERDIIIVNDRAALIRKSME